MRPELKVSGWDFEDYFAPATRADEPIDALPPIAEARRYFLDADIAGHPFFEFARTHKAALRHWAAQEVVITNHFSQVLYYMMSFIKNVHVRSLLTPVVSGEHSKVKNGVAGGSHPHLLSELVRGLDIDTSTIEPLQCTISFGDVLASASERPLYALGVLGVGNESMIIPEYTAVKAAFAAHAGEDFYSAFLDANILEDKWHCNLMERAAVCLFRNEADESEYVSGARLGVDARITYYDELLTHCRAA